jgi:hypothetical protein
VYIDYDLEHKKEFFVETLKHVHLANDVARPCAPNAMFS